MPLPRPRPKPAPLPRTRGQILADLRRDRAVLALLPVNDPRRAIMRARIDRLLDELLTVARV